MLSHVHIGIADYDRALAFYSALLAELGLERRFAERDKGWAGGRVPGVARPLFLIGRPFDGRAADAGNGQMIALLAPDRATVDRCHALALSLGGRDEGAPGLRPHYHADYYGAYFRDPDGNKLCVCCHQPEPAP
ncbi:MAG: VOC family protein [Reyranella sp.]|nr:VOC family protein [Reyranella sp.]